MSDIPLAVCNYVLKETSVALADCRKGIRKKPSELPVQPPVKFELVINMKTAQTLGSNFPLWPILGSKNERYGRLPTT